MKELLAKKCNTLGTTNKNKELSSPLIAAAGFAWSRNLAIGEDFYVKGMVQWEDRLWTLWKEIQSHQYM